MEGRESVKGEQARREGSEGERRGKNIVKGRQVWGNFCEGRLRMEEEKGNKKRAGDDAESGNGYGGKSKRDWGNVREGEGGQGVWTEDGWSQFCGQTAHKIKFLHTGAKPVSGQGLFSYIL
jgi:hypothetical protein